MTPYHSPMNRIRLFLFMGLLGLTGLGLGGWLRFETRMLAPACIDWRSFTNTCRGPVWIGLADIMPDTPPLRLEPGARIPTEFLRVVAQSPSELVICRVPGRPGLVAGSLDRSTSMPGCRKPT